MTKIIIPIPDETCLYIQRLQYEVDAYKAIIDTLIIDNGYKFNIEIYSKFMSEYREFYKEHTLALNEIKLQFLEEKYRSSKYSMTIEFETSSIIIEEYTCSGVGCKI